MYSLALVLSDDYTLSALDASTGAVSWLYNCTALQPQSPTCIAFGEGLTVGGDGTVYTVVQCVHPSTGGCSSGGSYAAAVDSTTGKVLWTAATGKQASYYSIEISENYRSVCLISGWDSGTQMMPQQSCLEWFDSDVFTSLLRCPGATVDKSTLAVLGLGVLDTVIYSAQPQTDDDRSGTTILAISPKGEHNSTVMTST